MATPPNVYSVALFTVACATAGLLLLTVPQRHRAGGTAVLGVLSAVLVWAVADAMLFMADAPTAELFWHTLHFVGPTLAPVFALCFALQYAGLADVLTPRRVWALAAVPLLTNLLAWTDEYHSLVRTGARAGDPPGALVRLTFGWGPWYYVHVAYTGVLVCATLALFGSRALRFGEGHAQVRRSQLLAAATALPFAGYLASVLGLAAIDYGPIAFGLSGFLLFMTSVVYGSS